MDKEDRSYAVLRELYDKEPIGKEPEELPEHEGSLRVFRDLTYNAGYGYLAGLIGGSMYGFYEGLIQKESTKSWKLARTSILNFSGRRMSSWANMGGTLGTIFTLNEALFRTFMLANKDRPYPWITHPWAFDSRNTASLAGAATGFIYKSTSGSFAIASGCAAAGAVLGHLNSRRYTPEKYFDIYKQYLPPDPMMM
jgi:hypothetical protein